MFTSFVTAPLQLVAPASFCSISTRFHVLVEKKTIPHAVNALQMPSRVTCVAKGWRDTLLGDSSSDKERYARFRNRARDFVEVMPLGLSRDCTTAYLSENVSSTRTVCHAMPVPVSRALDSSLIAEAASKHCNFDLLDDNDEGQQFLPYSDVGMFFMRIQDVVGRFFNGENRDIGLQIVQACLKKSSAGAYRQSLDLLAEIFGTPTRRVLCASVEEIEGLDDQSASIQGFLYAAQVTVACGEEIVVDDVDRIACPSPAFAISVASALNRPCHIARMLFQATSVRVFVEANPRQRLTVSLYQENELSRKDSPEKLRSSIADSASVQSPVEKTIPWECCYKDVLLLSDDCLRASLRDVGVPVTSTEERSVLLEKYSELMDEVERREMLIELAAQNGMYAVAAELQEGRSERGKIVKRMREAQARGDLDESFRLKITADHMKSLCADFTQCPGSYDPYLDQDPWYRPSR